MAEEIQDGTGGANRVKVDETNRMLTRGVQISEQNESLNEGLDWNIETGYKTLTTASASDLIYIKNTSEGHLIVSLYVVLAKASTGGSGDLLIDILRNPTGGTVVSDALDCNAVNMHFGSSKQPPVDMFYGGEGKTLTGHDNQLVSKTTADNRFLLPITTHLSRGSSVGVRITPPTGNTSMDINVAIEIYKDIE